MRPIFVCLRTNNAMIGRPWLGFTLLLGTLWQMWMSAPDTWLPAFLRHVDHRIDILISSFLPPVPQIFVHCPFFHTILNLQKRNSTTLHWSVTSQKLLNVLIGTQPLQLLQRNTQEWSVDGSLRNFFAKPGGFQGHPSVSSLPFAGTLIEMGGNFFIMRGWTSSGGDCSIRRTFNSSNTYYFSEQYMT